MPVIPIKVRGIYQHREFKLKMRLVVADVENNYFKMVSKWDDEGFSWEGKLDYLSTRFEYLELES